MVSSREPTPTHTPKATDRTPGTDSDSTRSPPGRTVRRMTPPSGPVVRVRVLPGRWMRPTRSIGTGRLLAGGLVALRLRLGGVFQDGDEAELAARVDLA